MDSIYAYLGCVVVRFRYLVVLAWIAVTIGCVVLFPSLWRWARITTSWS
jgi:putative drug exporter of the RND superfamily